jgi:RNA-dependent RNA polymerase
MDGKLSNSLMSKGDFSKINVVSKFAARLGQSFSSINDSIPLKNHDWSVIDDVERYGYCFTDGIGMISSEFAKEISKNSSSAFQIRFGGHKGVLAVNNSLKSFKILLRPSMCKFDCEHTSLEIVKSSSFSYGCLNRQLIILLSYLGIDDKVFIEKQSKKIQESEGILMDKKIAIEVFSKFFQGEISIMMVHLLKKLPIDESFLHYMLHTYRISLLTNLKKRSAILVEKSCSVIGVTDEKQILKSGQIFLKIKNKEETKVITGKVFVARNPGKKNKGIEPSFSPRRRVIVGSSPDQRIGIS